MLFSRRKNDSWKILWRFYFEAFVVMEIRVFFTIFIVRSGRDILWACPTHLQNWCRRQRKTILPSLTRRSGSSHQLRMHDFSSKDTTFWVYSVYSSQLRFAYTNFRSNSDQYLWVYLPAFLQCFSFLHAPFPKMTSCGISAMSISVKWI